MPSNETVPVEPLHGPVAQSFQVPQPPPTQTQLTPDNPPWGLLHGFVVWAVSVALLLFLPFLVVLPYVIYKMASNGSTEFLATDPNVLFLSIVGVIPTHILTFLLVWAVVTNRGKRPFWQTLGWTWPASFGPVKTIGTAMLLLGIGWSITHFFGGAETQLDQIIKSSAQARILIAFLAAVTGPLVEELVYRGVLYSSVQRALGMTWAIVIVSVLFAGVHVAQYFNNFGVILAISFLSVSLTMIRAFTGTLLPSYIIHFIFNGIQAFILILQPWIEKNQNLQNTSTGMLMTFINRIFS